MCERNTISTSEEDQVIPVMRAVQHGLSESPMLWGEEIDRMCSIELQKRGAPHGHFAIIFVDDTSVGVTQSDDKQLEVADDTDMDGVTLHHDKRIRSNRRMKQLVKTRAETERESNWCHPISVVSNLAQPLAASRSFIFVALAHFSPLTT